MHRLQPGFPCPIPLHILLSNTSHMRVAGHSLRPETKRLEQVKIDKDLHPLQMNTPEALAVRSLHVNR